MSWQLWVLIAAAASGVTAVLLVKLSQAQEVFERIVEPGPRPHADLHAVGPDEPARVRRRLDPRPAWFPQPAHSHHRSRGHH